VGRESDVKRGYHCAWQIHYHIVFPVKYRKALLDKGVVSIIRETVKGIEQRYAIEIEAMGMDTDHIHILCGAHPKMSPGSIVQIIKSITAREVFKQRPKVKRELWGGELWADGYYVATVGKVGSWNTVEEYVRSQGKAKEELKQLELF
jgi:putative transposase